MTLQKPGALNISMLRLHCGLPPPIKMSGYAPVYSTRYVS